MTPEPSLVGQIIYGYRVEEAIGTGSQGDIYRLKHPTLPDKYLALKVLRGENAASHELRSRFLQDAMAAAKVGTVGVVQPVQIDELADGTPYIVMELAPGISLDKDLLANGPLSVSAAVQIASAVASTVAQVHGHGIIHRDLKPGNLMVDRDGDDIRSVKLLDFGVAQVTGDLKRVKTAKGQFFGTRFYIAPETSSGTRSTGGSMSSPSVWCSTRCSRETLPSRGCSKRSAPIPRRLHPPSGRRTSIRCR
ncbi:MAG: serine/threonine protein kinase [Myxococcales bacterium]|nr:serine/threonine protein kinase [Myxococcales bacterium]